GAECCDAEQRGERRPRPRGSADRLLEPRLTYRARREERPPVAGTLERDGERPRGPRLQLIERERERPLDEAADLEPPRLGVDVRDVEVDQQVVQPDRGDVVPERLERQCVVPPREP